MNEIDISYADFRRVDLNLLVAFDALLQERHVGHAAERLFIGQPAMSHALARLRELFDDELFVRTGKRMEPTARALALGQRVRAWLGQGADFLMREAAFDPSTAEGVIRMAIPDVLETLLLPPVLAMLRSQAPGVSLRTQLRDVTQVLGALDDDDIDIAIVAAELPLQSWHHGKRLMSQGFNCIYSPEQLKLPKQLTLNRLATLDHVGSSHRGESGSVVDQLFEQHGLKRRVVASVASFNTMLATVRQAPVVTIQPCGQGDLHNMDGLVVEPLKTSPPLVLGIHMLWHARHQRQPLHEHVRGLIERIATQQVAATKRPLTRTQ